MDNIFAVSLKSLLIIGVFVLLFNFHELNSIQSFSEKIQHDKIVDSGENILNPAKRSRKSKVFLYPIPKHEREPTHGSTQESTQVKNKQTATIEEITSKIRTSSENLCSIKPAPEGTFKFVPLLSYPGSGNTWLRHLIELATGYQTTTVEKGDKSLAPSFIGEYDHPHSGSSIVVKTHWFNYIRYWYKGYPKRFNNTGVFDSFTDAKHCVFLLRRPVQAFLADFQKKLSKQICKKRKLAENSKTWSTEKPVCQANHTFRVTQHELRG